MKEQRNSTFDIAKAFGIFFLVSSHVRWWHITYVFTNFYMALFFFISGYFIKIEDMSLLSYIKSKIRSLYIPFVKFSLVFLIFHNFLYQIGITNGQYGIYDYIKKYWYFQALFALCSLRSADTTYFAFAARTFSCTFFGTGSYFSKNME